jgi:hypothetical protein
MNNWCICWFFTHILLGILIFKGLTKRRLYKSFGVKGLKLVVHIVSTVFKRLITPSLDCNLCEWTICCVTIMLVCNLFYDPVNVLLCVVCGTRWRAVPAYFGT